MRRGEGGGPGEQSVFGTTFDRCCARAGLVEWGRARPGEASVAVARGIRRTLNDDAGREDAAEVARA